MNVNIQFSKHMIFNSRKKTALFLVVICVLVRVLFILLNSSISILPMIPVTTNDSLTYMSLASMIETGDFSEYDGFRTPIYPILILLFRNNAMVILLFQQLLGIAISLILFFAFQCLSKSNLLGFIVGIAHSFNLAQLIYEGNIITETLTTFFLSLIVLFMFYLFQNKRYKEQQYYIFALLLGLIVSLAALTRPLCLAAFPVVGVFLIKRFILMWTTDRKILLFSLVIYVLPCSLLLGGWSYFNYKTTGFFSISTLMGANLTHWSGEYMEDAPAKYSHIKEVYIKHREQKGTSKQTIWEVLPELEDMTGLSSPQLSQIFKEISVEIIKNNTREYIENVFRSWRKFWYGSLPFSHQNVFIKKILMNATRLVITCFGFIFLLIPMIGIFSRKARVLLKGKSELFFVYCIAMTFSITQALLISVENSRYSVIIDSIIISTVLFTLCVFYKSFLSNKKNIR